MTKPQFAGGHCRKGHLLPKDGQCNLCVNARAKAWHDARPGYRSWDSMIQRCTNPKRAAWKNYGGRGIRVAEEWRASFDAFVRDVGLQPGSQYSLERIDNNGNYEPGNVRWATRKEQNQNRRNVRLTPAAALCIRVLRLRGAKLAVLAESFGVCEGTVGHIAKGRHWR